MDLSEQSKPRAAHEDVQRGRAPPLLRHTEGVVQPGEEKAPWRPNWSLPVLKGTNKRAREEHLTRACDSTRPMALN